MKVKWIAFICFLITFTSISFGLRINWRDKNGMKIPDPKKNDDSKYWTDAMANAMRDPFTGCLPKDWRNGAKDFYNSNRQITIMIFLIVKKKMKRPRQE